MNKKRKILFGAYLLTVLALILVFCLNLYFTKQDLIAKYKEGRSKFESQKYQEAIDLFTELGDFRDSASYLDLAEKALANEYSESIYQSAVLLYQKDDLKEARDLFLQIADYKDSQMYLNNIDTILEKEKANEENYQLAITHYNHGQYLVAYSEFCTLNDYKDSMQYSQACRTVIQRLMLSNTISAGVQYSASVSSDGKVSFVGNSFADAKVFADWENIVSIRTGNDFVIGLTGDGTVQVAKIKTKYDYRIEVSNWNDIVQIAAGDQLVVGLKADGTLLAQGVDGYGETDIDSWKNIVAIDAGWQHIVGLDRDGKIYAAGYIVSDANPYQIDVDALNDPNGDWTDVVAITTGGSTGTGRRGHGHIVGLKSDGTVVAAGDNTDGQCNVSDWKNIIAVSAGAYHTVGLTSDGHVLTTQNSDEFEHSIRDISSWQDVVAISAGFGFTLAVKSNGSVVGTGLFEQGQWDVVKLSPAAVRKDYWDAVMKFDQAFWR